MARAITDRGVANMHLIACMFLLLPALLAGSNTTSAGFPERPITVIVPFASGGPADTIARIIGAQMARTLGQPIIVENITGAGGTTGITRGSQAKPDGYTIMLGHMGTHGAAPAFYPDLKYDPVTDFAPIGLVADAPILIVTRKDFPANTLGEFVEYAQKNQDKLNEAHAGIASASHTSCTLLQSIMGIRTARVPYRGTALSIKDMIARQIDFTCDVIVNVVPHVHAGTVKALAIAANERSAVLKDVPTTAESGLPGFQVSAWFALFAPKGTPQDVVEKFRAALDSALEDQDAGRRLIDLGVAIPDRSSRSPDALQRLVDREVRRWKSVLRAAAAESD
jgi:putative tricarboxylic transport membrane protein